MRQYRQTIADLVGSFRPAVQWGDQRGLNAEYFKGRSMGGRSSALKRVDPQVNFDFGTEAPVPEITEPHEFSIRWQGSLLAPDTGLYDFVVRTEHALRLWVNDMDTPLVDRWVKSGSDTEYQAGLYLVGGRIYPAAAGVHQGQAGRRRFGQAEGETGIGPRDDRSVVESPARRAGADPVAAALDRLRSRAVRLHDPVSARRPQLRLGTGDVGLEGLGPGDDRGRHRGGGLRGRERRRAGRHPARWARSERQAAKSSAARSASGPSAVRLRRSRRRSSSIGSSTPRTIRRRPSNAWCCLPLKSPRFLFREVGDSADPYAVAARLSFGLWDSIPDQALNQAAAEGKLATAEQIAQQAERMLADYRAKVEATRLPADLAQSRPGKGPRARTLRDTPDFDSATIADLRTSLELLLEEVLWSARCRLSPTPAGRRSLRERSSGEVLWR